MHQYLFHIGSFPIRAYGLLFMLGIISSGLAAYYIMKKDGRRWHEHIFDFTLYCGLAGIVGGRLWDVFSSIGHTITTTFPKSPISGKGVWPFRAAFSSVPLPALFTQRSII